MKHTDFDRRRFLTLTGTLGLAGVSLVFSGCGSGTKSPASPDGSNTDTGANSRAEPFINGWQAISATYIANTWRNGQPLKLGLTDVVNSRGEKGIRFAYQKLGQTWTLSVISGSSMEALNITEGQILERSFLGNIGGWAGGWFDKARDALKKAVKKVLGFVAQVTEDTILGLVKKFLSKADGVLQSWISKLGDTAGLETAALILITIVRTKGGPREKLIAVIEAYLAEQVANAAVEAIYAA